MDLCFDDSSTFEQYINSLRKAYFAIRNPVDWPTPAAVRAAYGIRLSGKNRARPQIAFVARWYGALLRPMGQWLNFIDWHISRFSSPFASHPRVFCYIWLIREVDLFTPRERNPLMDVALSQASIPWRRTWHGVKTCHGMYYGKSLFPPS